MAQGYASAIPFVRGVVDNLVPSVLGGVNTTETTICGGPSGRQLVAGQLQVGTTCRIIAGGTCTSTAANASNFKVRFGPYAGGSDTLMLTAATAAAATSGTSIPFSVLIVFTVRTIGVSGTVAGSLVLINGGTTGISTVVTQVIAMTAAAINTTVASYITFQYNSAAATTTSTFTNAVIELFN